jgi:hypothetical protein
MHDYPFDYSNNCSLVDNIIYIINYNITAYEFIIISSEDKYNWSYLNLIAIKTN